MNYFKGKKVVITGGSSGIGEATAYEFAKNGADVIVVGLDVNKLEKVKISCESFGVSSYFYECDFSNVESINGLTDFIKNKNIHVDIFFLNAGFSQRAFALDTSFDVDKKLMTVNYFASVYLIKQFSEEIKKSKCTQVVVNTSISGLFGFPLRSAYCASKHALFGFFESLDLENKNVNVTFIIPGRINTEISKSAVLGNGDIYNMMDSGQAKGMDVQKCARKIIKAVKQKKHRKLIGKKELLMVYIHKYFRFLYYKLATKISST